MTLAKAVRHGVHSIASRGCVHRSALLPSITKRSRTGSSPYGCCWWAGLHKATELPDTWELSLLWVRTSETLPWVGFWACHCFLYENLVGGAVFILQLPVCFTFRISGCRKPTSVAALLMSCSLTYELTVFERLYIACPCYPFIIHE